MNSLAFVDHIYHQKTGSTQFLRDILKENFEIADLWIPLGGNKSFAPEILNQYDYVLFFQRISPVADLRQIKAKIIWVQMYDSANLDYFYWKTISNLPIKILAFSDRIYFNARKYGMDAINLKYYLPPRKVELPRNGNHIFFWYRGALKFKDIKKVIDPKTIDSFTCKIDPDPTYGVEEISEQDIRDYHIKFIKGNFNSKKDYLSELLKHNIFIAPRLREGIGMSFLEAMAMGQIVIANKDGTMDEYIMDKINGYLFDMNRPQTINFQDVNAIKRRSQIFAEQGYYDWLDSVPGLLRFVCSEYKNKSKNIVFDILYDFKLRLFKLRNGL